MDHFGREIKKGDIFVHGARSGNSGKISAGIVLEVVEVTQEYSPPRTKLKVLKTECKSWRGDYTPCEPYKSTIEMFDQLIVVGPFGLPHNVSTDLVQAAKKVENENSTKPKRRSKD